MKTWVYVNWCTHVVISERECEEMVDKDLERGEFDDDDFEDWLSDNYSHRELLEMDEESRTDIRNQYINDLREYLMDHGCKGYTPYSIDE